MQDMQILCKICKKYAAKIKCKFYAKYAKNMPNMQNMQQK